MKMLASWLSTRPLRTSGLQVLPRAVVRTARYQAFDSGLDPEEVSAARSWYQTFQQANLPSGKTVYSRSSGAGGQHVNKYTRHRTPLSTAPANAGRTESKATTSWTMDELAAVLPKVLHSKLCSSAYYSRGSNALSFQAQTQRNRNANAEENRRKLFEEILRVYEETIPGESSPDKAKKHEAV